MTRFLIVPLWQGSSSSRAMQLAAGARAIAEDLPRTATEFIEVPSGVGSNLGTAIARASAVFETRRRVHAALHGSSDAALIVGGGLAAALGGVDDAASRARTLVVVISDGQGDSRLAEQTGADDAFNSIVSRFEAAELSDGSPAVRPAAILQVGRGDDQPTATASSTSQHSGDEHSGDEHAPQGDATDSTIDTDGARGRASTPEPSRHWSSVNTNELITEAQAIVSDQHIESIYLIVDAAALAATELSSGRLTSSILTTPALVDTIRQLGAVAPVSGAALTGFAPTDEADVAASMGNLLRVIGALRSAVSGP